MFFKNVKWLFLFFSTCSSLLELWYHKEVVFFNLGWVGDVFILISYLKVYIPVHIVIDNFYFPIAIIFNVIRKVYSMTLDKIFFFVYYYWKYINEDM